MLLTDCSSSTETPVDLAELRALTEGDAAFERQLIETFAAHSREAIPELGRLAAAGDCNPLMRLAHSVKGAAASMQASRVMRAAAELEAAARSQDTHRLGQLAEAVRIEFAEAIEYLLAGSAVRR